MKNKKFISIIWGYHKQIFNFEKEQNYHMTPLVVMTKQGYNCEIFAFNSQVKIEDDPNFIDGIKVIYYKNIFHYLFYLFKNRKNIIYSNTLTIRSLIVGLIGKKTFFMAHDQVLPIVEKIIKRKIVLFFYNFFTKIRVINKGELNLLEKNNKKGYTCPLSISYNFIDKQIENRDKVGILIGNIYLDKNPEVLLRVGKELKKNHINFKIEIIGEDRYNKNGKNFKELVIENNLEKYIEVLGYKKPEKIKQILSKSLIYINTSISEGQCLSVFEGALSGNYLCLQNILSFPSVFKNNAFYHNDSTELYNNIIFILEKEEKLREKILENQKMILEKYNYKKEKECLKRMFLENNK